MKDLGIIISEDLKYHAQVNEACKRAHLEISRIRRSFHSRSPKFITDMFKLYVRPHLEYCVEMWNPQFIGDIKKMERVQNRMSKLIPIGCHMSPEERNEILGLVSHEARRLRGDLINTYKNINNAELFNLRNNDRTRGNDKTICVPRSHCTIKDHSFSVRAISAWNSLPNHIVNSESVNCFKRRLDMFTND